MQRNDRFYRRRMLLPMVRTTTANGQTISAATYGSGGATGTTGIMDLQGYRRVHVIVAKQAGTAQKLSKLKLGFQSGAATLFASCSPLTGVTSGIVLSSITTSRASYLIDIDLTAQSNLKRYLNCLLTTSTTSGNILVEAYGVDPEQCPPSTTGFTSVQTF